MLAKRIYEAFGFDWDKSWRDSEDPGLARDLLFQLYEIEDPDENVVELLDAAIYAIEKNWR